MGCAYFSIEKIKTQDRLVNSKREKKMPGSGVHYGMRRFSTDSLIEEIKPGTGNSCALCLDSIQEEGGEKVKKLFLKKNF